MPYRFSRRRATCAARRRGAASTTPPVLAEWLDATAGEIDRLVADGTLDHGYEQFRHAAGTDGVDVLDQVTHHVELALAPLERRGHHDDVVDAHRRELLDAASNADRPPSG